jgi:RHS repeat-associated protein
VTYTYDANGRRVQKSDGTLYWVDDSLRPLSVGTTSGSITRDYIFLGGKRIAFVPLSSGNPYYYLSDHLGSTAVVASGDGKTIQWEADYFPFGSVQQIFTNIVGNNYEFTGYENDSETGYNYANARFQSGRWGRFLSPDPSLGSIDLTNPQSLNRQAYVLNNATNMIDSLGLVAGGCPFGTEPEPSLDGMCVFLEFLGTDPNSLGPAKGTGRAGGHAASGKPTKPKPTPKPPAPDCTAEMNAAVALAPPIELDKRAVIGGIVTGLITFFLPEAFGGGSILGTVTGVGVGTAETPLQNYAEGGARAQAALMACYAQQGPFLVPVGN